MSLIPDPIGFVASISILLAQIGINSQNPFYNPIMDFIKGIKDIADQQKIYGFIQNLTERVNTLEQKQIPIEYFSSPQFAQELRSLLYTQQISELNEKKHLYANYYASYCSCTSVEKLNTQKYYYLLQNIDIIEYHILNQLSQYTYAAHTANYIYNNSKEKFPDITQQDIIMRLESLISYNLIVTKTTQEYIAASRRFGNRSVLGEKNLYVRTTIGTNFLAFIQDSEMTA